MTIRPLTSRKTALAIAIYLMLCSFRMAQAGSTDLSDVPMAVSNMVTPNVLVIYDNSQSMDAQMNGVMLSGNDPNTRSNIGRSVMRSAMTTYRSAFNWGLMTYGLASDPPALMGTYGYYLGSTAGMVFTSNCSGYVPGVFNGAPPTIGVSPDGGGRCIANPQPEPGREFITFNYAGDDFNIVDVLYFGGYSGAPAISQAWAPATNTGNPTTYQWWLSRNAGTAGWDPTDFNTPWFSATLTPTDAGYIPGNFSGSLPNNISRSLYIPRGWGYISNVTGSGALKRAIAPDSSAHYVALQTLLGNETSGATGEIKNGAVFTTLTGTLDTAKSYFATSPSPTTESCQRNFVMLVTDGLPTGRTDGAMYSAAARTNTCSWSVGTNACTSGTFGQAATDAIGSVSALRTTSIAGISSTAKDGTGAVTGKFDVQTYVVALGDTVANPSALSVMDAMAFNGGTERAIAAQDAASFANAITAVTDNIVAKVGSGAAVAVANAHVTAGDSSSYASSYNSGTWAGDVDSFGIDLTTGIPTAGSLWVAGSAATQLELRTPASRLIATSVDTPGSRGGVQFQPTSAATGTKLSAAQQALLNTPSQTDGDAVLAYLRGDRSGEFAGTYRSRAKVLGDMINSEPVLVREPSTNYADTGYTAFKSSKSSRTRMLFQGANDGMLHAFDAGTGAEAWAYVPNLVMGNLNRLSRRPGFAHTYFVDGTPVAGDVDFSNVRGASGGPDWRTVLVGGLGKGGRGYYALDVTDTAAANEVAVKNKVLWEFPNSINSGGDRTDATRTMGYSYGKPILVKTRAAGWVTLVTSGYNNGNDTGGDGLGHLFVVNPKTGDLIKDIPTTGCSTTPTLNPCGLAHISAYVGNTDIDNLAEYVYGGDLYGNVWRFDLTGSNISSWDVEKVTTLKDAAGTAQPITSVPELALVESKRMVFVGTGLYLGATDVPGAPGASASSTQTQTMYGLWDRLTTTLPTPLRANLQEQTLTTSGTKRTSSNNAVDYSLKKGWYMDLPTTGDRIVTDASIALGMLVFTSNIPSAVVCEPGGRSWEYFVSVKTGGLAVNSSVPYVGTSLGAGLASRPVLIQLPNGKIVSLIRKSDATTLKEDVPLTGVGSGPKRTSWRQLFN
jgi:type IV pilus assembly protein PilY1